MVWLYLVVMRFAFNVDVNEFFGKRWQLPLCKHYMHATAEIFKQEIRTKMDKFLSSDHSKITDFDDLYTYFSLVIGIEKLYGHIPHLWTRTIIKQGLLHYNFEQSVDGEESEFATLTKYINISEKMKTANKNFTHLLRQTYQEIEDLKAKGILDPQLLESTICKIDQVSSKLKNIITNLKKSARDKDLKDYSLIESIMLSGVYSIIYFRLSLLVNNTSFGQITDEKTITDGIPTLLESISSFKYEFYKDLFSQNFIKESAKIECFRNIITMYDQVNSIFAKECKNIYSDIKLHAPNIILDEFKGLSFNLIASYMISTDIIIANGSIIEQQNKINKTVEKNKIVENIKIVQENVSFIIDELLKLYVELTNLASFCLETLELRNEKTDVIKPIIQIYKELEIIITHLYLFESFCLLFSSVYETRNYPSETGLQKIFSKIIHLHSGLKTNQFGNENSKELIKMVYEFIENGRFQNIVILVIELTSRISQINWSTFISSISEGFKTFSDCTSQIGFILEASSSDSKTSPKSLIRLK